MVKVYVLQGAYMIPIHNAFHMHDVMSSPGVPWTQKDLFCLRASQMVNDCFH